MNALQSAYAARLTSKPADVRMILIRAYAEYLAGHIPEGFALLGVPYTGQGATALRAALEEAAR